MLREDQKEDTLIEIVILINYIHYMTTKFAYEFMIDQISKYYLKQANQLKVLAEFNSIYEIDINDTHSIGYILNYVFYEIIISGKLFKADCLFISITNNGYIKILTIS